MIAKFNWLSFKGITRLDGHSLSIRRVATKKRELIGIVWQMNVAIDRTKSLNTRRGCRLQIAAFTSTFPDFLQAYALQSYRVCQSRHSKRCITAVTHGVKVVLVDRLLAGVPENRGGPRSGTAYQSSILGGDE